jgi:hypothetical protein
MRALRVVLVVVPLVVSLLAPTRRAAAAEQQVLLETVKAEVHEKEVELRVTTTLREPVTATDAKPAMPPIFTRMELEGVLGRWGTYLLDHAHLLARAKPITGKVGATRIVEAFDAPIQQSELERVHGEVTLVYALGGDDPITISFDVLGDREIAPGVPWPILYAFDVHGPRSKHVDLARDEPFTFDVAEPSGTPVGAGPRLDSTTARRRRIPTGTAIGAIIFLAILYIGYSVLKKRMGR